MSRRVSLGLLAATGLIAALASAGTAAAQPDLVPVLNYPMNASVGVQNVGTEASGPSHLTINCTRFGKADGGCPEAPGMGAYVDPAFPNRAVIDVPALEPNETFNHDLSFWGDIPWTPGTYVFDAVVDAGNDVAESNEANNTTQSSYTQFALVGNPPPKPVPLPGGKNQTIPVRPNSIMTLGPLQPVSPKPLPRGLNPSKTLQPEEKQPETAAPRVQHSLSSKRVVHPVILSPQLPSK